MSNVEIPCPVCGELFITAEPVDPSRRCRACTVPDAIPRLTDLFEQVHPSPGPS